MNLSDYGLTWQDEFNGIALDASKWEATTNPRHDAFNTLEAVSVSDGVLRITTYTENGTHHTGFIRTINKFEARYGFFEARIRFDSTPGEWGAFWLIAPTVGSIIGDPANAGVEIDIAEHRARDKSGQDVSGKYVANLHWDGYDEGIHQSTGSGLIQAKTDDSSIQGEWHTYGVLWTPNGYTFTFDGTPKWSTTEAVSRIPEYLKLTCEVKNDNWAGSIPEGGFGNLQSSRTFMQVDWVRVWQMPNAHPEIHSIGNQFNTVGNPIQLTIQASDPDPDDTLDYSASGALQN
ncbi:MAG: glycoside hydrolase family 16 protein [Opitutales bacterium]|nr:glycoside hydrolase family 16 protein [Opitutales bacterium]